MDLPPSFFHTLTKYVLSHSHTLPFHTVKANVQREGGTIRNECVTYVWRLNVQEESMKSPLGFSLDSPFSRQLEKVMEESGMYFLFQFCMKYLVSKSSRCVSMPGSVGATAKEIASLMCISRWSVGKKMQKWMSLGSK